MSFPHDDKPWAATAEFLRSRLAAPDRVLAPDPFRFVIPRAERYQAAENAEPRAFAWIVVHKGQLADIPRRFLLALSAAARPIFANEVFVVFATSPLPGDKDLDESPHVRAFHVYRDALPPEPPRPAAEAPKPAHIAPPPALAAALATAIPARRPARPEARDTPPRPWLAPGGVPGVARERAFQEETDRLIADYLAPATGQAVLDIGCGAGRLGALLPGAALVAGIDVADSALARALPRHAAPSPFAFARMDAARLGFAESSFDAALMIDTIDALADPPAALAEAARVLARGGRLMVTAPNRESLPLRALRRLGLPVPGRGFSVQELTGMLRAVGLTVIRSDGLFLSPGWALPGAAAALAPLEEDPEFIEAARLLGRRAGPDYALAFALLARKG
ncbi:class I SAM-dependent methyltransferase [Falsiroseomonas stagni]|uniref:Methyltransferase domain-containing protein n=1 Tax=Falsiroseomonas stagni DSM 19981 TaxID=1123062 RepID=A0A1I4D6C0_9PROT|nr:methyltransferase domain-containing protein [Falsiroseomonas stagni]SFK87967.1 Methyltransferase domain-containing protein [Falsiroseomonas stagni DSM 19981]